MRPPLLAALAALLVLLAAPAAAPAAKTNIAVGMGDQSPEMFDNEHFLALKVKKARYFLPWNAADDPGRLAIIDAWYNAARRRGVRPLFHLDGVFTDHAPSPTEYKRKVRLLVRRYKDVKDWGVWNEVNSKTQPTFKLASRTAKYFLALRSVCKRCSIVALDLLDAGNIRAYIRSFYRALGRKKSLAKIVGMHNYGDTNRNQNNTRTIINEVRKFNRRAQFWMTETGGIAYFATPTRTSFPCNERRQSKSVAKMFSIARKYKRYIKRLYPYNFFATDCDTASRFDAGLIRRNGSRRPAYNTLKRAMKNFKR